jgi:hypothetical protein
MQHQQERRKDGQEDPWLTMALIPAKHAMMNVEIEVLVQLHLTWASQPNHGSTSVIGKKSGLKTSVSILTMD